uniref:Cytochrome c oxidase subunit 2 n=2 Tax=Selaginella moellendorffii TaxID=88036 RepID=F2YIA0_SELML|nr:cytochrome oxidase subunit 2 [Selaginella moellendorffii]
MDVFLVSAPFWVSCDSAERWALGFQDPATPVMLGMIDLHHDLFVFILTILILVLWVLVRALTEFDSTRTPTPLRTAHGTTVEMLWTMLPSIFLMFLAIPSFALLYSTDEVADPAVTIKAIGHQWFWTYECSDYTSSDDKPFTFDSYMITDDDLDVGQLRLLEVDNPIVVPAKTNIRMLITSADVLHSWAVPSLGVKCDAVPGRLNRTSLFVAREGVYYGQCSELCGTNHAFMPIAIEVVSIDAYAHWVCTHIDTDDY